MIESNIGFIGSGNMAEAIIRGILNTGICNHEKIFCSDINHERLNEVRKKYNLGICCSNADLLDKAEIVVLAVKPQQAENLLKEISLGIDVSQHTIISIAAGISTYIIESAIGKHVKVVRVMPNTPAQLGTGSSAFCLGQYSGEREDALTRLIFESIGIIVPVREELMDAVTALSGSGPAYVFKLCEMMIKSGIELGLPVDIAECLTVQTILGAAQMLKSTGQKASDLRKAVTSPGGTTEAALMVMENQGFEKIFGQAMMAACDRGKKMAADMKKVNGNG